MRTNPGGPQTVLEACTLTVTKARFFFTAGESDHGNNDLSSINDCAAGTFSGLADDLMVYCLPTHSRITISRIYPVL